MITHRIRALAVLTGAALLSGGLLAAPAQSAPSPAAAAQDATSSEVRFAAADQSAKTVPDGVSDNCGPSGAALLVPVVVSGLQGSVKDGTYDEINVRADITINTGLDLSARLIGPGAAASAPSADLFGWPCPQQFDGSDAYGRAMGGTYTVTDTATATMQPTTGTPDSSIASGSYRANSAASPATPTSVTSAFAGLDDLNGTWYVALKDQWVGYQATVSNVSIGFGSTEPDTTGPTTQITGAEDGATVDQAPIYALDSTDADWDHFECAVDGGTFTTCPGLYTVPVTELGQHTFSARSVDTTGNIGPAVSRSFTLVAPPDTTAPGVSISSGPTNGEEVDTLPTYQFSSSDADVARFECAVSADPTAPGTFSTCTSPYTVHGVAPGKYAFFVRAVDTSGNTGTAARGSFLWHSVACDDATAALTAAQADLATAQKKVDKAKVRLAKARKSGNPARIAKAKKKLAAAKAHLGDASDAVDDAQTEVDQDC